MSLPKPTFPQEKAAALRDLADSIERDLKRTHNEQFTLGPWRAELTRVYPPNGDMIRLPWDNKTTFDEAKANAALIAAAPEMYDWQGDTLDVLCQICRSFNTPDNIRIQLAPMISRGAKIRKKARGEE